MELFWKNVKQDEQSDLQGPYECPCCAGQVMLDSMYLDHEVTIICPYCAEAVTVKEEWV